MAKKFCFLIGYPLGHSISPAMHNAAYKQLELNREYSLLEVLPEKLKEAVDVLKEPHNIGFNVTIPHKQTILPYLDMVTELARKIGAVNTVKIQDRKLIGYNTDGPGFIDSLRQDIGFNPSGKKAVLLGAGGAGRAIAIMLAESKIISLIIQEPQINRLDELIHSLSKFHNNIEIRSSQNLQEDIDSADLLINTSHVGMYPKVEANPLPPGIKLHSKLTVYDIIYNPQKTNLLQKAEEAKAKVFSGLGMLVRQGALAFTIMNNIPAPYRTMYKAAKKALEKPVDPNNENKYH